MSAKSIKGMLMYGSVGLIAAIVGALCYLVLITDFAYKKARLQTLMQRQVLTVASTLLYGTVESVDLEHRTIAARIPNPFSPSDTRLLIVHLSDDAFIGQQYLLGENGEYSGLTGRTPASLSDIAIGTRIAMLTRGTGTKIESNLILFGDPL